ncbi:MAG TPA: serine/threonine-protein kinase [Nonomuraea sp.]|nr:serine/threonine-protein kinase [Nonomuraea sp.]
MEPTGAAPLRPTDLREIGTYRLLGRLGEGGMGTVFLARAPTGRSVALKVVKAEFANQEGFAARFHAEVENARRVASFCTAQVLDNGNTGDGRPYMVTEYISGTPLSDQISTYGAMEPGSLHGVALGVAAALAAIHVAGLVHRDLKPANVILSLSGPRVIDFGIARALDRETGFTLSGELLGSPGWWAPEQVRGEPVSPAADIFAWGCLVAYAGNGRHPFGRGDPITMAHRVLNTPPELGALPAPLNELVLLATSMDPAQRPSAQDLLIALVGGNTPPPSINPPTLVATEMFADWRPPRDVEDESDVTAAFTTPPPGDATSGRGQAGASGTPGMPGMPTPDTTTPGTPPPAASPAGASPAGASASGVSASGTSTPGGSASSGSGQGSFDERVRLEEEAAKEELARWPAQSPAEPQLRLRGLFRRGRQKDQQQPQPPQAGGPAGQQPPSQPGQAGMAERPRTASPEREQARQDAAHPGPRPSAEHQGHGVPRQAVAVPGPERVRPAEGAGQRAADPDPGKVATRISPEPVPGERDTAGGTRTSGTRWLIAAGAAVLAVVVTAAVLIATSARNTATTATGGSSQTSSSGAANDVGRRFALGDDFDDPVAIVPGAPECGLKEYEGKSATQGQLCVIRWSMLNPGGERHALMQPVVTMVDDRGAEHDPAPSTLPPAILPGGRVDGAFVFDVPTYRKPVKLTATMLDNGRQIEVAL